VLENMDETTISLAGPERVDELRELWLAMHHHHQRVATLQPLVADDETSWQRRRTRYLDWLMAGDGSFLVIADRGPTPVGYAMVHMASGPDDTWPVANTYADIYSLSVAPDARRQGIGTRLLDYIDAELSRRGVKDVLLAVMVGNADAQRLYERRGFRPAETVLYRFGGI
jgi:ribosomal protein S18 acetylase RimI-like enzyme